jgi:hypothetical protein
MTEQEIMFYTVKHTFVIEQVAWNESSLILKNIYKTDYI